MKDNRSFFPALLILLIIISGFKYSANGQVDGIWSGKVSLTERMEGITGWSEKHITVLINDNIGSGSITYEDEGIMGGKHLGKSSCNGTGEVILNTVSINRFEGTYSIETIGPDCSLGSNPWEHNQGNDIVILDQPLTSNPNLLAGTKTTTYEIPGGLGTVTTTLSWGLTQASPDVELIVTPADYDNWLPEPGPDEIRKGSIVMEISLKVRRKNGNSLTVKAEKFEIRLSNTSREPGITLNAPLTPSANQLPDLRLLPLSIAESKNDDQFLSMPCRDGSTGKVYIGSYDGGGYTTLTAEAILEDGSHIQGNLLITGGDTEIPVPKRAVGTKIGIAWLLANGNPVEMDDKEISSGNTHDGDGLSAYEEYRGVISQGKFQRLDPNKKELGIRVKKTEFSLFAEGISWFEHAADLNVIRFSENEIGPDRRLNKNSSSVHIYDQYVLILLQGVIAQKDVVGKTYPSPGIPKKIVAIKFDTAKMAQHVRTAERNARNHISFLPFSLEDILANTIAHEMGHGVNILHHADERINYIDKTYSSVDPRFHIFLPYSTTETLERPFTIEGIIGESNKPNQESGDVFCVMNYMPAFSWAIRITATSYTYYKVPMLPLGTTLCNSSDGTEFNKRDLFGENNYFGDAKKGNCLSQIKLKD